MTLVVANFSSQAVDTAVHIPKHALDCASMPHGDYDGEELLTGETCKIKLQGEGTTMNIHIEPTSATLWRFKCQSPGK
jgi:hypothetical protein